MIKAHAERGQGRSQFATILAVVMGVIVTMIRSLALLFLDLRRLIPVGVVLLAEAGRLRGQDQEGKQDQRRQP